MPAGRSHTTSAAGLGRRTDCNGYQRRHHDPIREEDARVGTPNRGEATAVFLVNEDRVTRAVCPARSPLETLVTWSTHR